MAALRARTRGAVTSDGLRCWICYSRRFHQWGSSLCCDKCRTYYLSTPILIPENFAKRCFSCGHRSLLIFPDITGCVKCGQGWSEKSPIEFVHIVASGEVVEGLVARSRITPDGKNIPYQYENHVDTASQIRRDIRLKEMGMDPFLDYRKKSLTRS